MTDELAVQPADMEAIEKAVMYADFSDLSTEQRLYYMKSLCSDLGLDIRRSPFQWIVLNGKTVAYAKKACTDQLRDIHKISIQITEQKIVNGVYIVQVRASNMEGRSDEDIGASPAEGMVGDALGNSMKRAVTQAKRRVTLSICGLGMLDESEVAQIPGAKQPTQEGPKRITPPPIRATLPTPPQQEPLSEAREQAVADIVEATAIPAEILNAVDAQTGQMPQPHPVPIGRPIAAGNIKPAKLPPAAAPIQVRQGIPKAKE